MKKLVLFLAVVMLAGTAGASQLYYLNFDQGTNNPAPSPYIPGPGEILPGAMALAGAGTNATETQDVWAGAVQGGQALEMMQGAAWPHVAGYTITGGPLWPTDVSPDKETQGFTVEVLINPDYTNTGFGLVPYSTIYMSKDHTGGPRGQSMIIDQTTGILSFNPGQLGAGSVILNSTTALQAGTWYHAAVVMDAVLNKTTLYIDGVPEASFFYPNTWENILGIDSTLHIGHAGPLAGRNFQGQLDAFSFDDTALGPGSFNIPEPATIMLLLAGGALLRRKRS